LVSLSALSKGWCWATPHESHTFRFLFESRNLYSNATASNPESFSATDTEEQDDSFVETEEEEDYKPASKEEPTRTKSAPCP